jgi:hypothetical protein
MVEVLPQHSNPHVSGLLALAIGLCAQVIYYYLLAFSTTLSEKKNN